MHGFIVIELEHTCNAMRRSDSLLSRREIDRCHFLKNSVKIECFKRLKSTKLIELFTRNVKRILRLMGKTADFAKTGPNQ